MFDILKLTPEQWLIHMKQATIKHGQPSLYDKNEPIFLWKNGQRPEPKSKSPKSVHASSHLHIRVWTHSSMTIAKRGVLEMWQCYIMLLAKSSSFFGCQYRLAYHL